MDSENIINVRSMKLHAVHETNRGRYCEYLWLCYVLSAALPGRAAF